MILRKKNRSNVIKIVNYPMISFFYLLTAYIVGSIPTGFMIARFAGIDDITQKGSGNIGATNVARVVGKKYFLLVFSLDAVKAGFYLWFLHHSSVNPYILNICAVLLIVGNSFSFFLRGKGGKGVATSLGIVAFFNPIILGLVLLIWLCSVLKTRNVGISSVIALFSLPLLVFAYCQQITDFFLLSILISWWGIWRHADNIRRFLEVARPA